MRKKLRILQYLEFTMWHRLPIFLGGTSIALLAIIGLQRGCGAPPPVATPAASEQAPATACADGSAAGTTRPVACPAGQSGQKFEVCTAAGAWSPVPGDTCAAGGPPACNLVTFAQVKPVFDAKCVGCHGQWAGDNFEAVKADFQKIKYRIVTPNAGEVMPPNSRLPSAESKLFLDWEAGGFPKDAANCEAGAGSFRIQELNAAMIALASSEIEQGLSFGKTAKTANVRFAIMSHKRAEGISQEDFRKQWAGLNKALNAVSREGDIATCAPIGPQQSVCGIALEDFGWTPRDWEIFAAGDKLKIVDNTTSGKILRQLTGSNQPWLHGDNLSIISQKPTQYYQVLQVPATLQAYLAGKGVDLVKEINAREVVAVGTFKSPISLQKHRGGYFFEADDGFCSITFDPNDINENLLESPIMDPFATRRDGVFFNFVASETICMMENGMQEYGLWAAGGARQDAAPNDVVRDTENPFDPSPTIIAGESCHGCHGNEASSSGFLQVEDEVGEFYSRSNGNLDTATLDFVKDIYGQTTKLSGIMASHNKTHFAALALVGQKSGDGNSYKLVTYPYKQNWTLKKLADFLLISEDELRVGIDSSNNLRAQLGILLTGNTITQGAVEKAIPQVVAELRLFED